jgi:FkbM family methyltransferase
MIPSSIRSKRTQAVLFGKPFHFGELDDLTAQYLESVSYNQYHVENYKGGVIIDAGANVGMFSIFAARTHPNAEIYAFEPFPKTFNILKENTKYYPNIRVFNAGLGDRAVELKMVETPYLGCNYISERGDVSVAIKTIDSLGLPVGFIKMDTEGYEAQILKGAERTIQQFKPIIAMSAYHHPEDKIELPNILNAIVPYQCELRHDCEEDLICLPLPKTPPVIGYPHA